jgi:4-amino-4-deoxy-L-arabinose transferase-like glycosyltransferase
MADVAAGGERPGPGRTEWLAAAGIGLLGLVLRLAHLQQIRANDPFFDRPSVDARVYHEWAIQIAGGQWLGDEPFFMAPLYPYFLSGIYWIFGPSFLVPRLVHCLLGAATCVLVWRLAREFFDHRVSLLAGGLAAFYSMFLFYEGTLLVATVLTALTTLTVLVAVRALAAPSAWRWAGVGSLVGLTAVARPSGLLFAPLLLLWMFGALRRDTWKRRVALAAAFLAGGALLVLPVTFRNWVVTGDATIIATSGGSNFYSGNNPDANGAYLVPRPFSRSTTDSAPEQAARYQEVAERELGRELRPSEASTYWLGRGLAYIRENPVAWLRLEARKLALFLNAAEIWNTRSFELSRRFSWILQLPLISFGVIAPLAFLGIGVSTDHAKRLFPLYAMLGVYLVTALLFFVLSRYRLPAVPVLIVFAARGVVYLLDAWKERRFRVLAMGVASTLLFALGSHAPIIHQNLGMAHFNLGNRYKEREAWPLAIEAYMRALSVDPYYVPSSYNLALVYEQSGEHRREAIRVWEYVLALSTRQNLNGHANGARRHLSELGADAESGDDPASPRDSVEPSTLRLPLPDPGL